MAKVAPYSFFDVRILATACGLEEICLNETSRVISFRRVSSSNTRYNVYYTTGTVSTSLDHPRQGKTQLFRRNVDMDLLREIFLNPRIHTDLGYQQISKTKKYIDKDVKGEEEAARIQKEKLLAERAAIDKEIEECQAILDHYEKERQEKARKEAEEQERKRKAELEESKRKEKLAKDSIPSQKFDYATWCGLRENNNFKKNFTNDTTCVAIAGDTYICLYDDGDWHYSSGIITNLHKKLHTRAFSHPSPVYVAMGSLNRYYIRFANGRSEWCGPENMSNLLENTHRVVRTVAFGANFEDYFIVFEDGYWDGYGSFSGLWEKLNARQNRTDLDRVSLGPNGEWFLLANNGRAWWGNMSDKLLRELREVGDDGYYVRDVQFGDYGTYFIWH